jgi:hypothetical protein
VSTMNVLFHSVNSESSESLSSMQRWTRAAVAAQHGVGGDEVAQHCVYEAIHQRRAWRRMPSRR